MSTGASLRNGGPGALNALASADAVGVAGALLPASSIAAAVSTLYHDMHQGSAPSLSLPTENSTVSSIAALFAKVSTDPPFLSLLRVQGQNRFSLGLTFGGAAGISAAHFGFYWETSQGVYTEYWTGELSDGLVTGPQVESHPLIYQQGLSTNWGGWEFWCSPGCSGASTTALGGVAADGIVPTISVPPQAPQNVPRGFFIDAVASWWVGLSPQTGGGGGLLQTGYETDATNHARGFYTPWWELTPGAQQNYMGGTSLAAGDFVLADIQWQTSGQWLVMVYDQTQHKGWSQLVTAPGGWLPYRAQHITEAFSIGEQGLLITQQIAQFQGATQFRDSLVCSYGVYEYCSSGWLQYHVGQYADWYISQYCAFNFLGCWVNGHNADPSMPYGYGQYYPSVGWATSTFDWNYFEP
jgi:hypothetical protein